MRDIEGVRMLRTRAAAVRLAVIFLVAICWAAVPRAATAQDAVGGGEPAVVDAEGRIQRLPDKFVKVLTSVRELVTNKGKWEGKHVNVRGIVDGKKERTTETKWRFVIRDDENVREDNQHFKVECDWHREPPPVGTRVYISASVESEKRPAGDIDEYGDTMDLRLVVVEHFVESSVIPPPPPPPPPPKPPWLEANLALLLFIGLGLFLIVLLALLYRVLSQKPTVASNFGSQQIDWGGDTIRLEPKHGRTVSVLEPPAGTLKILKGRFEVIGGDEIPEIRFYVLPGETVVERTFGSKPGDPMRSILLKSPTVSRMQARVIHVGGKYRLINLSTTNLTTVNGRELAKNEELELEDGAEIEMGEVRLIYHAGA